ncbi:uncharacterized protein LOC134179026 isoform X2 [Corticium candelabrum]|uniref:uncharacterized protein LOC134179026 isoform X2 n=1 Tax=Corticium candelabrum TaxID=121492 RepID=UPI002E262EEB|nr:uncharacterized protein LOC134179026 isoform X2 [Corticium candelabrum]
MLQSDVMNSDDNESDEFEASGEVGDEKTARDVEQTWVMARISSATSILPAVVQTGRALTGRLQTWIASQLPDTVAGGELLTAADTLTSGEASPGEMLHSVAVALRRQHNINEVQSQLGRLNTLANMANYVKCRQVESVLSENRQNVDRLCSQVTSQTSVIRDLTGRVSSLREDVECQRSVSARLERDLNQQTVLFQSSVQQTRKDIERQQSLLTKQQDIVNSLVNSKIKQDLFVDGGLLGCSLLVVNSFIVNFPLKGGVCLVLCKATACCW